MTSTLILLWVRWPQVAGGFRQTTAHAYLQLMKYCRDMKIPKKYPERELNPHSIATTGV
jgi:hypothetical protein